MTEATTHAETAARKSVLPILSVNFVGTLGFSIVVPFMVFLVARWGGNAMVYGILASTYSFFQLIGAPILGRWSDRFGRRKVLLLSQLGTLLSWAIFLTAFLLPTQALLSVDSATLGQFAVTLPLLAVFLARAADGLTGGNVSVANAYLADITDDDHRTRDFGRMAISTNLGFVAGPALAGVLGATAFGEVLPVAAALAISLVASLLIAFGLKETSPRPLTENPEDPNACKAFGQEPKECFRIHGRAGISTRDILGLPQLPALLAVNFLAMLGFSFFYTAFPAHAAMGLDWAVADTGTFFVVLSLLMAVVQGPVLDRLSKRISDALLVAGGCLVLSAGFALLLGGGAVTIYGGAALIALGNGLMWPTFTAVLARHAGSRYQGAVQGLAGSLGAAASIVGLIAGGVLYTWIGPWVFVASAGVVAAIAPIMGAVGGATRAATAKDG